MRKVAILVLSLILCISLCPLTAFATGESFTLTLKVGNQTLTYSNEASYELPAPGAPAEGQAFAGWYAPATDTKATVFLPAGATVTADVATELTALFIGFKTRQDAELRFVEGDQGLRFLTDVQKSDLQLLTDLTEISMGTLIAPQKYLILTEDVLSHAAIMEETRYQRYVDVPSVGPYTQTATQYTFAGSITKILPKNTDEAFCAVGYLKVDYTNDTEGYIYASSIASGSISLYKKAVAAFSDRSETSNSVYKTATTYGFSPYTTEEIAYLQSVLDSVINLRFTQVDGVWTPEVLPLTPAYVAPFTVTGTKNAENEYFCLMVREGSDYRFDEDFYLLLEDGKLSALGGSNKSAKYKILATSNGRVMEIDFNAYG